VNWFLKKTEGSFTLESKPLSGKDCNGIKTAPPLTSWGEKEYDRSPEGCLRVIPDEKMEGFFIAVLKNETCH